MTNAPDFIPNSEFVPDSAPSASSAPAKAPDFIPNSQFIPDDSGEKSEDGLLPTLESYERGLENGLTGGFSDVVGKVYRNKIEGQTDESIQANKEAHPVADFLGNLTGTTASIAALQGAGVLPKATSLAGEIALNTGIGAGLGLSSSVSHDLAFGDPNLTASKMLEHAGISMLLAGGTGALATTVLGGAPATIKYFADKIRPTDELLKLNPDMLGPLDKFRMGLFHGLMKEEPKAHEALVQKLGTAVNSLNGVASDETLKSLGSPQSKDVIEKFIESRKQFLSHFGDSDGKIDPDEILSYITNPAAKNSTEQTVAFNHFFDSFKNVSKATFENPTASQGLEEAQANLQNWLDLGADYGTTGPEVPYQTSVYEGTPYEFRAGSYGNPEVSPWDYQGPRLAKINGQVKKFYEQVQTILKSPETEKMFAKNFNQAMEGVGEASNPIQNLARVNEAVGQAPEKLGWGAYIVSKALGHLTGIPFMEAALPILESIRGFSGEGGAYRAGDRLASHFKVFNGMAEQVHTIDQKIGEKARLIFTGASEQEGGAR